MAINAPLRPGKTELIYRAYLTPKLAGLGGPIVTRNPDEGDRGEQWVRLQPMPLEQLNEIEFENPAMIHAYDLDEDRALETIDVIAAHILAAKQIRVLDTWVPHSGIESGYVKRMDPDLIEYTRYQMTAVLVTKGKLLV